MCDTDHRSMRYLWITRWWCYNIGQWPLQNLGYAAYCYIDYFWTRPDPPSYRPMSFQGSITLLNYPYIHQRPLCCRKGWSSLLGVIRLHIIKPDYSGVIYPVFNFFNSYVTKSIMGAVDPLKIPSYYSMTQSENFKFNPNSVNRYCPKIISYLPLADSSTLIFHVTILSH